MERETEEEMSVGEVRDYEAANPLKTTNPALRNQTSSDGQNSQIAGTAVSVQAVEQL